jgi:hypothetical protein
MTIARHRFQPGLVHDDDPCPATSNHSVAHHTPESDRNAGAPDRESIGYVTMRERYLARPEPVAGNQEPPREALVQRVPGIAG